MGNKLRNVDDYYLGLDIGTESVGWAVTDKAMSFRSSRATPCGAYIFLTRERPR